MFPRRQAALPESGGQHEQLTVRSPPSAAKTGVRKAVGLTANIPRVCPCGAPQRSLGDSSAQREDFLTVILCRYPPLYYGNVTTLTVTTLALTAITLTALTT
ncbi:hypothetical protein BaRGS_00006401 [Batillaria attramentaria]|uniref:Uncharacterized protein n=1 Tax=Batillaria attramentaria TaxID=370345 RepID=A0ABD0LSJ3_9CAEN